MGTVSSIMPNFAPGLPTFALLLACKDCKEAQAITRMSEAMRRLGWRVCLYWINTANSDAAHETLLNLSRIYVAALKHPEERIVFYHAGVDQDLLLSCLAAQKDTLCRCSTCGVAAVYKALLRLPNDLLVVLDHRISLLCPESPPPFLFSKPDYRRRKVTTLSLKPADRKDSSVEGLSARSAEASESEQKKTKASSEGPPYSLATFLAGYL